MTEGGLTITPRCGVVFTDKISGQSDFESNQLVRGASSGSLSDIVLTICELKLILMTVLTIYELKLILMTNEYLYVTLTIKLNDMR